MEFLPIKVNEQEVYAGFRKRLYAMIADALILLPVGFFLAWLKGFDRTLAIFISVPTSILFVMFNVYFNARFGGTPGKIAVGIRITKPDGSRIGWGESWKRSSVDVIFAFVFLVVEIWMLTQVAPDHYASLGFRAWGKWIQTNRPDWFNYVVQLQEIWIWSEVVVLLFNKRKRALHDFIAGTVVINKEFAEQSPQEIIHEAMPVNQ